MQANNAILRRPKVEDTFGLSRSTLYLHISQGLLTHPVNIGIRAVGWPSDEINAIKAARIAGKSDEEIKKLVASLEIERKIAA